MNTDVTNANGSRFRVLMTQAGDKKREGVRYTELGRRVFSDDTFVLTSFCMSVDLGVAVHSRYIEQKRLTKHQIKAVNRTRGAN